MNHPGRIGNPKTFETLRQFLDLITSNNPLLSQVFIRRFQIVRSNHGETASS